MRKNIVLVGFMGTGKTTVGKVLARNLGRDFLETDDIIEKKEGRSIREIFKKKGEMYFRGIERDVVKEVSEKEGVIISSGGGVIVYEENFKNIKKNGILICLQASPEVILERTKNLTSRPLLNTSDRMKKIKELLQKRAPYYSKADFCINTDNLTVEQVVEKIERLIGGSGGKVFS